MLTTSIPLSTHILNTKLRFDTKSIAPLTLQEFDKVIKIIPPQESSKSRFNFIEVGVKKVKLLHSLTKMI